jgi:hypothetical protein
MEMSHAWVTAFRIAGIGEWMGTQTAQGPVVNHHLNVLNEVGRRLTAMSVDFREIMAANHSQYLLDLAHR